MESILAGYPSDFVAFEPEPAVSGQYGSSAAQIKRQVQNFWQRTPCDSWFAKGQPGTPMFYRTLDEHRYRVHPKLLSAVGFDKARGLRVLEIGCGCGSEAERFVRAGAHYTALDLTDAALNLTRKRFQLSGLHGRFVQGDAESMPFAEGSFDLVYSHGVLHHTPDTAQAIREVHRVLSPAGRAVIMLYHRNSFNYQINLRVVRRLRAGLLPSKRGMKLVQKIWKESSTELSRHAELIAQSPAAYLNMQNMLNRNTDGPDNPLSQVFSRRSARPLFSQFCNVTAQVMFWNQNWLPLVGKLIPRSLEDKLASHWGWHLWLYAQKRPQKLLWKVPQATHMLTKEVNARAHDSERTLIAC
jgi:ubiquinone/menaquinone biosynthesis C-methylase UbiE